MTRRPHPYELYLICALALATGCPSYSETFASKYQCSNGAEFILKGNLSSAIRRSGVRVDLLWGGDSFVLISDNGASNARLVGSSGYQVVIWRDITFKRYGVSLGEKCKELIRSS